MQTCFNLCTFVGLPKHSNVLFSIGRIFTIRKRTLGQGYIFTGVYQSFCPQTGFGGGSSLYDVTSCLAAWSHVPSVWHLCLVSCSFSGICVQGFSVQGVCVQGCVSVQGKGSLSSGVSVHGEGVSVKEDLCAGVSVQRSLSKNVSLSRGERSLFRGVSAQASLCPGGLCPGGETPPIR